MNDLFESPSSDQKGGRQLRTVVLHAVIACLAFGIALISGDVAAIALTGIAAAFATATLVRFWADG
jgi:hypothetical protein